MSNEKASIVCFETVYRSTFFKLNQVTSPAEVAKSNKQWVAE